MNRLMMIVLVWAACLFPASAAGEECKSGETFATLTGRLDYDMETTDSLDTPYRLVSQGITYWLYPEGPYLGMKWSDPGFEMGNFTRSAGSHRSGWRKLR
jgi:hypothetical protein